MTAQPKLLELAERGRKASAEAARTAKPAREVTASEAAIERYRLANPPNSIDRGEQNACPACDGLANREGNRLSCCWCGVVTEGKRVVDACRLFTGKWPGQEGST